MEAKPPGHTYQFTIQRNTGSDSTRVEQRASDADAQTEAMRLMEEGQGVSAVLVFRLLGTVKKVETNVWSD